MATTNLGRLQKVQLRDVWVSEPGGFTPWLAQSENLKLLGDTVGLELELEAQEKNVGPFRADILCKDTATDHWVLIENQLEPTDHTHLGQLLTYAAGLKAVTIVWVAQRFTEEHRAALDWLNEITNESFTFFGLEVELWRIGESAIAPKFNVVSKPNDWSKTVAEGAQQIHRGELTEGKKLQLDFWTNFQQLLLSQGSSLKTGKPQPQYWIPVALGKTGCHLDGVASLYDSVNQTYDSGELRAEVVLDDSRSKQYFEALEQMKPAIESEMGEPMTWCRSETKQECRIFLRRAADIKDKAQWPDQQKWLLGKLELLHRVFSQRIREIANMVSGSPGAGEGL